MASLNLTEHPHARFNPLTREWVLVSPHRTQRPWQGQIDDSETKRCPAYDAECYICPGNTRANGMKNPDYKDVFVFDNDFPAVRPDTPDLAYTDGLMEARGESGICRVVSFSPRHDLTLSQMEPANIRSVVDVWAREYEQLGALRNVRHVQIFENRGSMMGCSNPHPHCQVWATSHIPNEPAKEQDSLGQYLQSEGRCLICDYLKQEEKAQVRLIASNSSFAACVPFWAVWPFETLVIARRHVGTLPELTEGERDDLAGLLKRLTARYDNLFSVPFPYSMGFHQRPADNADHREWHLHAHFYPPLLRSATVRKFMVGFEMLGMPQRDISPETAAETLRAVPDAPRTRI